MPARPRTASSEDLLSGKLVQLGNLLLRSAAARYRKRFGLRTEEWRILALLGSDESLALTEEDALTAEKLALVHNDPFDRMLIGQAIMQGMTILTPDAVFREYPVRVVW